MHLHLHIKEVCAFREEKGTKESKKWEDSTAEGRDSKWTGKDENDKYQKSAKTSACSLENIRPW